ncbi:MAG TPA: MarC family protein [Ktedonobacteraceae bacterium]|nr:MarC family protein [Ktedonobacteraceae bacterium]
MRSLLDLFLPIFIGMGPIKLLLVYMALTKNYSTALQRKVAIKTIITGTIIAIVVLLAGAFIMKLLHFTTGALSIAVGLILLILALNIVLSPAETKEESGPMSEEALMSMAIYPLAIPLLLNPVGIVSLTVFSAEAQGLLQLGVLIILVLVVAAIDLGVFLISHRLDKYLTKERILVLEKQLGIFLAALAIQLMIDGLVDLHIITAIVH